MFRRTAKQGHYPFIIQKMSTFLEFLQLQVKEGGIHQVGFFATSQNGGSTIDFHTRLWAPRGALNIALVKSGSSAISQEAHISVFTDSGDMLASATLPANTTGESLPVELDGNISIHLLKTKPMPSGAPYQSGGTQVVDILVEPPRTL